MPLCHVLCCKQLQQHCLQPLPLPRQAEFARPSKRKRAPTHAGSPGAACAHDVAGGHGARASPTSISASPCPQAAAAPVTPAVLSGEQPDLAACRAAGALPEVGVVARERWAEAVLCAAWPLPPRGAATLAATQGYAQAQAGAVHTWPTLGPDLAGFGSWPASAAPTIAAQAPSDVPMPLLLAPGLTGPRLAQPALGSAGGLAYAPIFPALAPGLTGPGSAAALGGCGTGSAAAAPALHVWRPLQQRPWDSDTVTVLQGVEDLGTAPSADRRNAESAAPSEQPWRRRAVSEPPDPAQPSPALAGTGAVSSAAQRRRAAVAALARARSAAAARGGSRAPQSPAPIGSARLGSAVHAPAPRRAFNALQRQAGLVQQARAAGNQSQNPGHNPARARSAAPQKAAAVLGAGGAAGQIRHAQPAAAGYAARFRLAKAAPGAGTPPPGPAPAAQGIASTSSAADAALTPLAEAAGVLKVVLVERAVSPASFPSPRSAASQRTGGDAAGTLAAGPQGAPASGGARLKKHAPALARATNRRVVRRALEQVRGFASDS